MIGFRKLPKAATLVSLTAMFAVGLAMSEARSQSALCLQLTNQLKAIDSGGGFNATSGKYQEYDRAVRDQRAQIAKTESALRRNGCILSGIFGFGTCGRIRSSLDQMHANLRQLEQKRASYAPTRESFDPRRNALIREIQINGCNYNRGSREFAVQETAPRKRSLLEQIFGVRTYGDRGNYANYDYNPDLGYGDQYGTFRTLCVRTCDGYYFPISFSTVPERFGEDEFTCQSMCPAAQVELYYHRMPSQDSEDMISYRMDMPYSQLPTAFEYRKTYNPDCTCKGSGGFAEIYPNSDVMALDATTQEPETPAKEFVGTPKFRSDPWLDPEFKMNSEGNLTIQALERIAKPEPAGSQISENSGGKNVRIVGPSFFPVQ